MKTVRNIVELSTAQCIVIYNRDCEKIALLSKISICSRYMTEMYNIDISVNELLDLTVDSIDVNKNRLCIFTTDM